MLNYRSAILQDALKNKSGLEIGGLHNPAELPASFVEYLDVISKEEAQELFKELDASTLVDITYIGDVSKTSLYTITKKKFEFVIANHIIEHVANPILFIKNIFEGIKDGGYAIISAPDKNYSFDKNRGLTEFNHILAEYYLNVMEVEDSHYIDFLNHVHPETFESESRCVEAFHSVKNRREHVHVWNSDTFREHLIKALEILLLNCTIIFESIAEYNHHEYFCVIQKGQQSKETQAVMTRLAVSVLKNVYMQRNDLIKAYAVKDWRPATYTGLLNWAVNTSSGMNDADSLILSQYKNIYSSIEPKEFINLWNAK